MAGRRGARGASARNTETPDADSSASDTSITTVIDTTATTSSRVDDTELLAIKLNRKTEKIARFESHRDFLTTCIKDKIIPPSFKIELDPSIGNHDDQFLASWYDKIEKLSLELMADTVKFCKATITSTATEANSLDEALKTATADDEYNEIKTIVNKYNEQKKQELDKTKRAKHRKLRWNIVNGKPNKQQQQRPQQQQPPPSRQDTGRRARYTPPMRTSGRKQQPPTDGDESAIPKDQEHRRKDTRARTYADILKPKATRGLPPTSTKITSTQPMKNTMYQKNYAGPRTDSMDGGIQDLLTNTQQAFELLQRNFERLVDFRMTQMDAL